MDNTIITTIIATGIIGLLAAAVLTIASKLMYVKVDEKLEKVREMLPGANCGVCGYSGCDGYAKALAQDNAALDLCRPGGAATFKMLTDVFGVDAGEGPVKKTAIVRCSAMPETKRDKMEYEGIGSCFAAEQLYGGQNACTFGCLGYGDCVRSCPKSAICISGGVAHVDSRKCIGCERCIAACPRNVITMQSHPVHATVLCRNTEKGAVVRKKCEKGCIACSKCVRECPSKAIEIKDTLAVIDSTKCDKCGHCVEVCISKCIAIYE